MVKKKFWPIKFNDYHHNSHLLQHLFYKKILKWISPQPAVFGKEYPMVNRQCTIKSQSSNNNIQTEKSFKLVNANQRFKLYIALITN